MTKSVEKIIAKEFLWVIGTAIVTLISWVLVAISIPEFEKLTYFPYMYFSAWDYFCIYLIVIWGVAFPLRYIYLMTKWSLSKVNQEDIEDGEERELSDEEHMNEAISE